MFDPPPQLRRTLTVHAAHRDLSFILHDKASALRTFLRHAEFFLTAGAQIGPRADHGWNHFAGLLNEDNVADPDVLSFDLFLVVQRGSCHSTAADGYGLERCDWRQSSSPAHLN